jgi:hypothetical protein
MPVSAAHALTAKPLLSNLKNHQADAARDDGAKRAFDFQF